MAKVVPIALAVLLVSSCKKADDPPPLPVPPTHVDADPVLLVPTAPRVRAACVLRVHGTSLDPLVFPTIEGAAEFDNAILQHQPPDVANAIISTNLGFSVPRGSRCSLIVESSANQLDYAKVRVIDGPLAGRIGWLPRSQAQSE